MEHIQLKPIIKWAGGKSRLINKLLPYFPAEFNNYHEPFLGSGAVFFSLFNEITSRKAKAYVSDLNDELINLYEVIRDDVEGIIEVSKEHIYDKDYYYYIRSLDPDKLSRTKRASRMLYLNKTCFNGLWRVNSSGQFNVAFGNYTNPKIVDVPALRSASSVFKQAKLYCGDFEEVVLKNAKSGDFVYLDPPYMPLSSTANFTGYTPYSFTKNDHLRLKRVFTQLVKRGCFVALSNSNTEMARELYEGYNIKTVSATRAINCNTQKRGAIQELLILSYPDELSRYNYRPLCSINFSTNHI